MKNKLLLLFVTLMVLAQSTKAYDFSAVAPSGQTLYFDINDGHAEVVNISSQNHAYNSSLFDSWITGDLIIPDTVYFNNIPFIVSVIQSNAFRWQSGLRSIVIPSTVTVIGSDAFSDCSNIVSVIYSGSVSQWCSITFQNNTANPLYYAHRLNIGGTEIQEIAIPEGVTEIKQYAFYYWTELKSVTIPSTVTTIGSHAFHGCYKLQPVTVPSTVTSIGVNAFCDIPMIIGANNSYGARCLNGYVENGLYFTDSSKTTLVGASPYLDSITIPVTATSIATKALYGYNHLQVLTIPSTVTSIYGSAFSGCSALTPVNIPSSVTYIGGSAFQEVHMIYYYGVATGRPWGARAINAHEEDGLFYTSSAKDTVVYANADLTTVVIPNTVTTICDYALSSCHNLTTVALGTAISSLGDYAFTGTAIDTLYYNANFFTGYLNNTNKYGLDSVRVVIFNNPIILWPEYLIRGNQRLKHVALGNWMTSINDNAFLNCSNLVSVTIPNSVSSIGNSAFSGCSSLASVTIPDSVSSIGSNAFEGCSSLRKVYLGKALNLIGANAFQNTSIDTLYYDIDSISDFPRYNRHGWDSVRVAYIGDNVRYWPDYLLGGCQKLESVMISDSITSIRDRAFYNCSSLASVTIGNSVTSIGDNAFMYCSSLPSVTIGSSVTSIGNYAFYGCSSLVSVTIPNSETSIGSSAFDHCSSLASVTIPNSVTSIGSYAFYGCSSLASIIIPNSVVSIGNYAFASCSNLTSATIPNSVDSLSSGIFSYCRSLASISLPDSLRSIPSYTFNNCTNLVSVTIPNTVTSIGTSAFYKCSSLASITIPPSVTTISSTAFCYDSNLTTLTLGRHLKTIERNSFEHCVRLDTLYFNADSMADINQLYGFDSLRVLIIGDSVRRIPRYCFANLGKLNYLKIGGLIDTIQDNTFQNCTKLATLEISDATKYIGNYAFQSCTSLNRVTMGRNLTSLSKYAFYGCSTDTLFFNATSMTDFNYNSSPQGLDSLKVVIMGDSVQRIPTYLFMNKQLLNYVKIGEQVDTICDAAFYGCANLTTVIIPNSVKRIESSAFNSCYGLDSIVIPNSVTSIGSYAFSSCSSLASVTIPSSVTSIGYSAFSGCSNLASVTIPNSVTRIEGYTFSNCSSLDSITIPNSITGIEEGTFSGCSGLTNVNIPNSVTSIGNYSFSSCSGLITIMIPDSVSSIGNYAFRNCNGLKTITIPDSVTFIGVHAFNGCSNLDSITLGCGLQSIDNIFGNCTPKYVSYNCYRCENNISNKIPKDSLISLVVGDSITVIPYQAFKNYIHLEFVTIGSSVRNINNQAFLNDSSLHTVLFGESVTNIGYKTFEHCINLHNITLNDNVSNISSSAFNYCGISYLSLGSGISWIGDYAFANGNDSMEVHLRGGNPPSVEPNTFGTNWRFFYIPCGSYLNYQNAWQNLANSSYVEYHEPIADINVEVGTSDSLMGVADAQHPYLDPYHSYLYYSRFIPIACDSTTIITATPYTGFHFEQWSNGSTANPDTLHLDGDSSVTAIFAHNIYTLTLSVNDTSLGTVTGGGVFYHNETTWIEATCTEPHYHFVQWSDGVASSSRNVTLTQDTAITAIFAIDTHHVSCFGYDGYFEGTGDYPYGATVEVSAYAYDGFHFGEWDDGCRDNPRTFVLDNDIILNAIFVPDVYPEICMVSVQDNRNMLIWQKDDYAPLSSYNIYREGETSGDYELAAIVPYDSASVWVDEVSRPMSRSYRYKISATDIYDIESDKSSVHKTMHLTINKGQGNNWNLIWTPYEGILYSSYQIYRGSDINNLELINTIPSSGNTTYTDYDNDIPAPYYQVAIIKDEPCEPTKSSNIIRSNIATDNPNAIDGVNINGISIYSQGGHIVLEGANSKVVSAYDIIGRPVVGKIKATDRKIALDVPSLGVYIVKIDGLPAQKVVVK